MLSLNFIFGNCIGCLGHATEVADLLSKGLESKDAEGQCRATFCAAVDVGTELRSQWEMPRPWCIFQRSSDVEPHIQAIPTLKDVVPCSTWLFQDVNLLHGNKEEDSGRLYDIIGKRTSASTLHAVLCLVPEAVSAKRIAYSS